MQMGRKAITQKKQNAQKNVHHAQFSVHFYALFLHKTPTVNQFFNAQFFVFSITIS